MQFPAGRPEAFFGSDRPGDDQPAFICAAWLRALHQASSGRVFRTQLPGKFPGVLRALQLTLFVPAMDDRSRPHFSSLWTHAVLWSERYQRSGRVRALGGRAEMPRGFVLEKPGRFDWSAPAGIGID